MPKAKIALLLVLLPCILPRIRHFFPVGANNSLDFDVYYTAATLARQHQGIAIYSGADTGADPQLVVTDASTTFGRTALQSGVRAPMLYVYPPILADLVIGLSLFSLATASKIWTVFNLAQLPVIAFLIVRLLKLPIVSLGSLIVMVGLFCSAPILSCIAFGQISIFLFLLWIAGVYFYCLGWRTAAGFVFSLATAIKLTPLIVIVPLLIWKEWKLLRSFTVSMLFFCVLTCIVNSPHSLTDYFLHVVPSMTRGIPHVMNWSITASVQRLYVALCHGPIYPAITMVIPRAVVSFAKLCAIATLVVVSIPIYRLGSSMKAEDRIMILALFAVLAVCISPVSWAHAYPVCFFALSLCWARAIRKGTSNLRLITLMASSVTLTSYLISYLALKLVAHPNYNIFTSLLLFLPPAAGLALFWIGLSGMSSPDASGPATAPKRFEEAMV